LSLVAGLCVPAAEIAHGQAATAALLEDVNNFLQMEIDNLPAKFLNGFALRGFCEATVPRPRLTSLE